ncbi:hypothetical protein ACB098_05G026500 [Castanea mollissima]
MDREERIKNACMKIVECINAMSFVNLDDQRVHSLVMMREIARGVVENKDRKVTKSDVTRALHSSIEKMASTCRDIVYKLSKMSYKGLDDQRIQSLLRVKEIAAKHAKVASVESDTWIKESLAGEEMQPSSVDVLVGGAEIMVVEESLVVETELRNEDGHNVVQKRPVTRAKLTGKKDMQIGEVQRKMPEDEPPEVEAQLINENGKNQLQEILSQPPLLQSLIWPPDDCITLDWIWSLISTIKQFSQNHPPSEFQLVMPISVVDKLVDNASSILSKEPNCVKIDCLGVDSRVVVVGDIHGQFHDLLYLLENAGFPSENQFYVFNGNYVDRGAWGLEVFLLLLAWKVLMPHRVYLLRGNHESKECTLAYGFEKEVKTKFGDQDPSQRQGICKNRAQGRGLWWGPDCTEAFLKMSKLKLIIRSHEGPDMRTGQHLFGDMLCGYSLDHEGELGKLYTLFSAPDYPQFGRKIFTNEGAYAVLQSPNFESPSFHSFKAVEKPKADPFVDVDDYDKIASSKREDQIATSDEEDEIYIGERDLTSTHAQSSTAAISSLQKSSPVVMASGVDFEALGISNPPSWSVLLPNDLGGTQLVQVPQAPEVEGLPLPPNLEEPHKSAYEYLFKLIAGLKHMLQTREIESKGQKRKQDD